MFYGDWSHHNFAAHVPVTERQSVSRGELRGVHALLQRKPGERLVVVLDLLHLYRGMVNWSPKWHRHGWRTPGGEAGRRDLWEHILWERERAGGSGSANPLGAFARGSGRQRVGGWVSSAGPFPKKARTEPQWEALGLVDMCSDEEEAQDSGHCSEQESMCSGSWSSGGGWGGRARGSVRPSATPGGSARRRTTQGVAQMSVTHGGCGISESGRAGLLKSMAWAQQPVQCSGHLVMAPPVRKRQRVNVHV